MTTYKRVQHAAHYSFKPVTGHDLETWTIAASSVTAAREQAGDALPRDAKYHSGYLDKGVQYWMFVRTAPLTGTCDQCRLNS